MFLVFVRMVLGRKNIYFVCINNYMVFRDIRESLKLNLVFYYNLCIVYFIILKIKNGNLYFIEEIINNIYI